MEEIPLPEQGTSQGTDWGSGTSEDDRTVVKAMKAANAGSEPWSKASGEGDLDVAPNTATTRESTAAVAKDDANVEMTDATTGKYTIHNRLNKRSADLILPSSDTESSSTSNDSLVTAVAAAQPLKTASLANLKTLSKIIRVTLPLVAEDEGEVYKVNPFPNAASGRTEQAIEPTLDRISPSPQGLSYTRSRGGSGPGASSGSTRGGKRSSRPTTSAAAYNTVAAATRNYLVHVYRSRDDLEPFWRESKWTTTRDYIKTAIWAYIVKNGVNKDLSVKDWAFHKEKRIGLIFCTSEVKQKRVIQLIIYIGVGAHIVEAEHDVTGGMKMSFKMPVCFESQQMTTLLEAIFVINGLSGECGRRELRMDRPKNEAPYTVVTVHFLDKVVEFAEQHDWRLQGPDGMIFGLEPPQDQLQAGQGEEGCRGVATHKSPPPLHLNTLR
jgi:hypothetical protein